MSDVDRDRALWWLLNAGAVVYFVIGLQQFAKLSVEGGVYGVGAFAVAFGFVWVSRRLEDCADSEQAVEAGDPA